MAKIDYMKITSVLSKTLNLETIDMKFRDNSTNRLEVVLGGPSLQEKKFYLTLSDFSVELVFSKEYIQGRDFTRWLTRFEYELEQAFFKNAQTDVTDDAANHIISIKV